MATPLILIALLAAAQDESIAAGSVPPPTAEAVAQAQREFTPEGAPADDYAFTGWCKGVLSGHMALAERVQSILPLDEVQQKIGLAYLKGYDEALTTGGRSRTAAEREAAARAEIAARANWDTAMRADMQLAADTYLAWQLPGRCEHAAKRVAGRDDLFRMSAELEGEAISANSSAAVRAEPTAQPASATAAAEAPPATSLFDPISLNVGLDQPAPALDPSATAEPQPVEVAVSPEPAPAAVAGSTPEAVQESPPPAAQPPAPQSTQTAEAEERSSGKIISMPRKGRLLPWGRRD